MLLIWLINKPPDVGLTTTGRQNSYQLDLRTVIQAAPHPCTQEVIPDLSTSHFPCIFFFQIATRKDNMMKPWSQSSLCNPHPMEQNPEISNDNIKMRLLLCMHDLKLKIQGVPTSMYGWKRSQTIGFATEAHRNAIGYPTWDYKAFDNPNMEMKGQD